MKLIKFTSYQPNLYTEYFTYVDAESVVAIVGRRDTTLDITDIYVGQAVISVREPVDSCVQAINDVFR